MIIPAQLARIFPRAAADTWAPAISKAWQRFGFETLNAQAGYLGICGNETGGFVAVKQENTSWSAPQMLRLFPRLKLTQEQAAALANTSPENRANVAYAGILGNGDAASGDGYRYRGRGVIQLTGRSNYQACGEALGIPLVSDPDALFRDPETSAAAAAWFMVKHAKILAQLDKGDEASFLAAARKVGWTDETATARRLEYRRLALSVLRDSVTSGGAASVARPAPPPTPQRTTPWASLSDAVRSLVAAILRALKVKP